MRFHSRKRLSFSLSSNCSIVTPSAPAAPPLLFTFSHAAQISRLGMSCDLPDTIGSLMRLLPSGWSHQSARTAPPLRSPTNCDTQAAASRRAFARSEREPRSRSCCLYAGPHLGSKRVSPRLIPRLNGCPGFEVTYEPFDTSTAEGSTPIAHLLDPHLTRSFAAPFPTTLSTTVAD